MKRFVHTKNYPQLIHLVIINDEIIPFIAFISDISHMSLVSRSQIAIFCFDLGWREKTAIWLRATSISPVVHT